LIATQAFANLGTGPQPDFIMPANVVANSGKVCYRNRPNANFGVNSCVAYGSFTGNAESNGIAPALTTTGNASLTKVSSNFNNAIDFALRTPTPCNNAGQCLGKPSGNPQSVTTAEDTPIDITLTG